MIIHVPQTVKVAVIPVAKDIVKEVAEEDVGVPVKEVARERAKDVKGLAADALDVLGHALEPANMVVREEINIKLYSYGKRHSIAS